MTEPLAYWCVWTFGTEHSDDFHLRGLFSKEEDSLSFASTLPAEPQPRVVRMLHDDVVEQLASAYVLRAKRVLEPA